EKGGKRVKMNIAGALRAKAAEEPLARNMGIKVCEVAEGFASVEMKITPEMENIFGMAHGGAIFSLLDEAFEMASNSHGTVAVALNMNVTYIAGARTGDVLRAEARETSRTRRTAHYTINVRNGEGDLVATCVALVYRKDQPLPFL
ncbi:MAG: PaaI family thioesterase, partial [Syntrophales bacterium]|nr:PaaI family thioesterase [Syntrophales bacterium]